MYPLNIIWVPLVTLFMCTQPGKAQNWTPLGLEKEYIYSLSFDPVKPEVIYIGSASDFTSGAPGGLFKTTDLGASWDTLMRGGSVVDLDVNPHAPEIIYACLGINSALMTPGVVKSTDGGQSWAYSDSGIFIDSEQGPTCLSIDPQYPETLYAGTGGFNGGYLYRSFNGAKSWTLMYDSAVGPSRPHPIVINPETTQVIYVEDALSRILRSSDGGRSWQRTSYYGGGFPNGLAISPDGKRLYIGRTWLKSAPATFLTSSDFGTSWQSEMTGLPDSTWFYDLCLVPLSEGKEKLLGAVGLHGLYEFGIDRIWRNLNCPYDVNLVALTDQGILVATGSGLYIGRGFSAVQERRDEQRYKDVLENYPNPFNASTEFRCTLARGGQMRLAVYDILGHLITEIFRGDLSAGTYAFRWNAQGVATGAYTCVLTGTSGVRLVRRVLLLK